MNNLRKFVKERKYIASLFVNKTKEKFRIQDTLPPIPEVRCESDNDNDDGDDDAYSEKLDVVVQVVCSLAGSDESDESSLSSISSSSSLNDESLTESSNKWTSSRYRSKSI
ncbi:hypothetical protein ACLKA7_005854 [Drosophila subpalustris]